MSERINVIEAMDCYLPDVDGVVHLADGEAPVGSFVDVALEKATGFDFEGVVA